MKAADRELLDELERDPVLASEVPMTDVPSVLAAVARREAQLATARVLLAARLVSRGATHERGVENERLLSTQETAIRCGMSVDWLYRHAGTLPFARRIGRSLRFSEAGLVRWIAGRQR